MESFERLPATAAWRHETAREGFEVVFFTAAGEGIRIAGETTAVEDGEPWWVGYEIELDAGWVTRRARVRCRSRSGARETLLAADGAGTWHVDGAPAPQLDGCIDVDLESSALTNAFPIHRLRLDPGVATAAPAAWVRAPGLGAERLEQTYRRLDARRFDYASPRFGFRCELVYDAAGLVTRYPGIAQRAH
jgi:hypothetical protein